MSISENLPIKFSDVTQELWGTGTLDKELMGTDSSKDAFAKAIDSYFHPTYKGNKDRLSNFRGYPYSTTCDFTMSVVPTSAAIIIKASPINKNDFVTGELAVTETQIKVKLDSIRGTTNQSVGLYYNIGGGDVFITNIVGEGSVVTINNLGSATNSTPLAPMKIIAKQGVNISNTIDIYKNEVVIANDTKIYIYFDSSGSMDSTLTPLENMKNTLLKNKIIQLYNNDETLYNNNVKIISNASEETFNMLNLFGEAFPTVGNVIVMVFQDEASPYGNDYSFDYSSNTICTFSHINILKSDINTLKNRIDALSNEKYRAVIFQVNFTHTKFKEMLQALKGGLGCFTDTSSLQSYDKIKVKYDIVGGETSPYYLDIIVNQLKEFGYNIK